MKKRGKIGKSFPQPREVGKANKPKAKRELSTAEDRAAEDLTIIREIDESDVDLPYGQGDWIDKCLKQLAQKQPLNEADRDKADIMIFFIRQLSDD